MDEPSSEEGLEALIERHLPGLRAYVRLRMGPELRARESASDLVQSTCREVLQHAGRFRHGGETGFRHWLYTTAQRKVANRVEYYRAGKRDAAMEVAPGGEESLAALYQTISTPSRGLMTRERIQEIEQAFDGLSEPHREVILLARIVGLGHAQVARTMGRSEQATRSLLHRALAELADRLESTSGEI
ncbi:MAG TPA: sigma-70 family RNA polymerase sigma factor [Planctomycetota bacterium]|nr:sigma-70 family RNA polymerase sigma factor [Planctomycetota bacterium]